MRIFNWLFATIIGWRVFLIILIVTGLYTFSGEIGAALGGVVDRVDHIIGYEQ